MHERKILQSTVPSLAKAQVHQLAAKSDTTLTVDSQGPRFLKFCCGF